MNPRILLVNFSGVSQQEFSLDEQLLRDIFGEVSVIPYAKSTQELFARVIEMSANFVYIFAKVDEKGTINGEFLGDVINQLEDLEVKVLFIASSNDFLKYRPALASVQRKTSDLILVIDRKNELYQKWLKSLMTAFLKGQTLAESWVKLTPQDPNADRSQVPNVLLINGKWACFK